MKYPFSRFIKDQWNPVPAVVKTDLTGKTIVVTGANVGIGLEAAKHFARMNPAKLILACRSKEKGEEALTKIKEETSCEAVELWILDLAKFDSVKEFSERFDKEGGRLDILVENAAIIQGDTLERSPDGWELTCQVNHLSTSLLALLLLPLAIKTAEKYKTTPRIVIVSSAMHFWTAFDQEMLEAPNPLQLFGSSTDYISKVFATRYQDTKLLNVLFARGLSKRLHKKPVIINVADPGYCYSNLRRNYTGIKAAFDWLMEKALARTSEAGSRQLVWAAIGGEDRLEDLCGAYMTIGEIYEPSDFVISDEGTAYGDILWDNLIDELIKVEPKVAAISDRYLEKTKASELDHI